LYGLEVLEKIITQVGDVLALQLNTGLLAEIFDGQVLERLAVPQ